ncbi:MAG: hypothetical protein Q7T28_14680, partial [Cypionkella sp.]|nr:hypothetical protein [Cypionkella sp.]
MFLIWKYGQNRDAGVAALRRFASFRHGKGRIPSRMRPSPRFGDRENRLLVFVARSAALQVGHDRVAQTFDAT